MRLASICKDQGKLADAEILFGRELGALENSSSKKELQRFAHCLYELCDIKFNKGDLDASKILIKRALTAQEKASGSRDPASTAPLCFLPLFQRSWANSRIPRNPISRALLWTSMAAVGPEDIAVGLVGLADTYTREEDYKAASPLFHRALALREKALGRQHPKVAECLYNIGVNCYMQSDLKNAEFYLSKSLNIYKILNINNSDYARDTKKAYAKVLRKLGRENEASELETELGSGKEAEGHGEVGQQKSHKRDKE